MAAGSGEMQRDEPGSLLVWLRLNRIAASRPGLRDAEM